MVLLTATDAAVVAAEKYRKYHNVVIKDEDIIARLARLSNLERGSPVDHTDLIEISRCLVDEARKQEGDVAQEWRLESLLKGAKVYREPPAPKPEPVRILAPPDPGLSIDISTDRRVQSTHETSPT